MDNNYVEFGIDIAEFLDRIVNLTSRIYKPYKKPRYPLLYINKTSNHPPQIINELPEIISGILTRSSWKEETFDASKEEYEQ